jgi:uncharacterized membrane protein (UPF0136 family)
MGTTRSCPQCQASLAPGEYFCTACGFKIQETPEERRERIERLDGIAEDLRNRKKIDSGRKWLLAVSILTLIGGFVFYFMQHSKVEEEIENVERTLAQADAERLKAFDGQMQKLTGMTWEQAKRRDRGMVTAVLVSNLVLTAVYLGLFFWSASQPFSASLIALMIFLAVQVLTAIIDPKMLIQGWLIKILVVAGLGSAVSAAYKHRKMREAG